MRAIVLEDVGKLCCREMPEPEPARDEVKIRVACCGICGSDLHGYEGKTPVGQKPLILGHEFSGVVSAAGSGVTRFKPGDRVTAQPFRTSDRLTILGVHIHGGMAEYVCVEEKYTVRLPDSMSFEEGALIEPACVSGHAVLDYADLQPNDYVAVIGAGPIGLMACVIAKAYNAKVILVGRTTSADRLALGKARGADYTFMSDRDDVPEKVKEITGGAGVKVAFETGGTDKSIAEAISLIRVNGKLIELALTSPLGTTISNFADIVQREIVIQPSNCHRIENFTKVIDMAASGIIRFDGMITKQYPFEACEEAFRTKAIKNLLYP